MSAIPPSPTFKDRVLNLPELLSCILSYLERDDFIQVRAVNQAFHQACIPWFFIDINNRGYNDRLRIQALNGEFWGPENTISEEEMNKLQGLQEQDEMEDKQGSATDGTTVQTRARPRVGCNMHCCVQNCIHYRLPHEGSGRFVRSLVIASSFYQRNLEMGSLHCSMVESFEYSLWYNDEIRKEKNYLLTLESFSRLKNLKRLAIGYFTREDDFLEVLGDLEMAFHPEVPSLESSFSLLSSSITGDDDDATPIYPWPSTLPPAEKNRQLKDLRISFMRNTPLKWSSVRLILRIFPGLVKLHLDGALLNNDRDDDVNTEKGSGEATSDGEDSSPRDLKSRRIYPAIKNFRLDDATKQRFPWKALEMFPNLEDLQVDVEGHPLEPSFCDFEDPRHPYHRLHQQQRPLLGQGDRALYPNLRRLSVRQTYSWNTTLEKLFDHPLLQNVEDLSLMARRSMLESQKTLSLQDLQNEMASLAHARKVIRPLKHLNLHTKLENALAILKSHSLCSQLQSLTVTNRVDLFEALLGPQADDALAIGFPARNDSEDDTDTSNVIPLEILTPEYLLLRLPFLSTLTLLHLSYLNQEGQPQEHSQRLLNRILKSTPHLKDFRLLESLSTLTHVFSGLGRDTPRPPNPPPIPQAKSREEALANRAEYERRRGMYTGHKNVNAFDLGTDAILAYRRRNDWNAVEGTETVPVWAGERPFLESLSVVVGSNSRKEIGDGMPARQDLWYRFRFLRTLIVNVQRTSGGGGSMDSDEDEDYLGLFD